MLLRHTKLNSGPLRGALPLYVEFDRGTVRFIEADPNDAAFQDAQGLEAMLISALRKLGRGTKNDIVEHTGAKAPSVANMLTKLKTRRVVEEVGKDGRAVIYQIITEGE